MTDEELKATILNHLLVLGRDPFLIGEALWCLSIKGTHDPNDTPIHRYLKYKEPTFSDLIWSKVWYELDFDPETLEPIKKFLDAFDAGKCSSLEEK